MVDNKVHKIYHLLTTIMCCVGIVLLVMSATVTNNVVQTLALFSLLMMSLLGFLGAFVILPQWGNVHSVVGKSILFLQLALACWTLGITATFIIEKLLAKELSYPGVPDYFFIFIDPLYALALIQIMRYSGAWRSLKDTTWSYLVLLLIPIISLYINYRLFFGDASYFETIDLAVMFDLFYSFGSIAVMALTTISFMLCVKKLGGKMKGALYLLFCGFIAQYIGDIAFSILEYQDMTYNGNLADFVYFISISLVTMGILQFNTQRLDTKVSSGELNKEENVS